MNQEIKISILSRMATPIDHTNSRHVDTVELTDIDQFSQTICTQNGWAPSVFKDSTRNNESFIFTQIMGLDVDSGLTLAEAIELFKSYKHVIATTKSHQREKTTSTGEMRPACDRFRVILFLESPIEDKQVYLNTWFGLFDKYPFIDKACKDPARFYSKSNTVVSIQKDGILVKVIKESLKKEKSSKKAIPKIRHNQPILHPSILSNGIDKGVLSVATREFIQNGMEEGSWNSALFKASKDMQEQKYSYEEAIELLEGMTNPYFSGSLDEKDMNTIESAFKLEPKYPARITFPVLKSNSSGTQYPDPNHPENMKSLISNLMRLSPALNELKNKIYLDKNPFTDFDLSNIRLRSREHSISPSKDFIEDCLNELARNNSFHPFKQVVEAQTWDGNDHIQELFNTITIEDDYIENKELYLMYLKKWLVGIIAKVYRPGSQNLVLTLKGAQGKGKSRWLSKFNVAQDCFGEGAVNPDDKDHVLRHLNYIIWHVSELDGVTRKRDVSALKDFFTKDDISVREPYGRFDRTGKSVLSFCASVNDDTFLTDQTGNRRYLIIPVSNINANHNVSIQQCLAQAKSLFDSNYEYWLNETEIAKTNEVNENYLYSNHVDFIASKVSPGTDWVSGQEIFNSFDRNYKYTPADITKLGILLGKKGIKTKRMTVNGTKLTCYQVQRPLSNFDL